jgi:hypothetical protein
MIADFETLEARSCERKKQFSARVHSNCAALLRRSCVNPCLCGNQMEHKSDPKSRAKEFARR